MKGGKVNMNKKGGMTMLVVVGIAALIVGVFICSQIVSPQFSPKSTSANSYVKAHSCDADEICEVENLISKDTIGIMGPNNYPLILMDGGTIGVNNSVITPRIQGPNGGPIILGSPLSSVNSISIQGQVIGGEFKGINLRGNGTAYICVDSIGRLIRSDTPCR